jgi:rRNA-processing protein FCF1
MKVILDTNFLMVPFQFKVDILGEIKRLLDVNYELLVPNKVMGELNTLTKKGNLRERKSSRIGLELAKNMKSIKVLGIDPDDAILSIIDNKTIVCTNDKELRKRVMDKGGRVIFLKQGKFLELEGGRIGLS